jgi:hypothetical protein
MELPLSRTYFPYGFRLDLETNSRDAIEAAEESWGGQRREFASSPLRMRVVVRPEGDLSQPGMHRKWGSLYAVVSDPQNFAQVDLESLVADVHVSRMTASDHSWLRWFFLESLPYVMLSQRNIAMAHAGLVARDGLGVMLSGASAAGKSTLAYACARSGWTFLADDCTALLSESEERIALGRPRQIRFRPDATRLFPELERFKARARPTGKIAMEASPAELGLRTADRTRVGVVAFLERGAGAPSAQRISGEEAVERLLADMPSYGDEVDAMHERAVSRLATATAVVLRPLGKALDANKPARRRDSLGQICTITSGKVDAKFGTAHVEDGAAGLNVHVVCSKANTLKKGDRAILVDFDSVKDTYEIEPVDWLMPQEIEAQQDPARAAQIISGRVRKR